MKDTLLKWRIEEYEILAETQNQVKVRVNALYPVKSRNGRVYSFEEMLESARTMNGKLINVNHNDGKKIGNVEWSKANKKTQVMEVEGTVNKEPYTYMIKSHDPKIKGWSVQADFRQAQCIHCSKKFDTMETLKEHLIKEEHINNIEFEPKDIVFNGLALVVEPEVPGIPNTSYMAETVGTRMFGSLEEMVNTLESEENSWLLNKFGNREAKPMSKNYAIENKGAPVAPVSKSLSKEELQKITMPEMKSNMERLTSDKIEVITPTQTTPETPTPNIAVEKIVLKEAASIGKLIYEEETPTPFEQCIKDGGTPEECAAKFKETVTRNNTNKAIMAAVNEIIDHLSKPILVEVKDDVSWQSKIDVLQRNIENRLTSVASEIVTATNTWNSKVAEIIESIGKLPKEAYIDGAIKEALATIKPYDDSLLKEALAAIKPYDDKPLKETVAAIKIPDAYNDKPLHDEIKCLKETVASQKKDFETVLAVADKNISETKKTLEERIESYKAENKSLKESVEKQDKTLKETTVLAENTADKIAPKFKAATKGIDPPKPKDSPVTGNPMDQNRRVS